MDLILPTHGGWLGVGARNPPPKKKVHTSPPSPTTTPSRSCTLTNCRRHSHPPVATRGTAELATVGSAPGVVSLPAGTRRQEQSHFMTPGSCQPTQSQHGDLTDSAAKLTIQRHEAGRAYVLPHACLRHVSHADHVRDDSARDAVAHAAGHAGARIARSKYARCPSSQSAPAPKLRTLEPRSAIPALLALAALAC